MMACLPGAIFRDGKYDTVLIDPDKCINCASCAMVCPFGVIRYHVDTFAPPGKIVAVKCDNCIARQENGQVPACVETCMSGALTFEDSAVAMKRKTDAVTRSVSAGMESEAQPPGFVLLNAVKKVQMELREAKQSDPMR
jgi:carbon-monoxide dehydrogenase iron sulfur subunit